MRVFDELFPAPPRWDLDWARVREALPWVRDLAGVEQDPVHHAEGDVETHTRMACEALSGLPAWRSRPCAERVRLFAAVLLHDVAKPVCTRREEDGRVTAHGHSRRGELTARRLLWEAGAERPSAEAVEWREHVAALVRHHQVPFWALERPDLRRIAFRVSLVARNDDLVLLATADLLGRRCGDTAEVLDNIGLYGEHCAEQRCLEGPRDFPSDHARSWFFRGPDRDPDHAAHDDTRATVTVMSGLPGAGKDTWIARHRPGLPVVAWTPCAPSWAPARPATRGRWPPPPTNAPGSTCGRVGRSCGTPPTSPGRCATGAWTWPPPTGRGWRSSPSRPRPGCCGPAWTGGTPPFPRRRWSAWCGGGSTRT